MRLWLKSLRENKNLTQVQCASVLGISQGNYCEIEAGDRRKKGLPLPLAAKLSELFGVSLDYIQSCEVEALNKE